jgi:hypothetical protein
MSNDPTQYTDFLVECADPVRLDDTLQSLPNMAAFVCGRGVPGGISLTDGCPTVRVFGDTSWFRFAVEHQGYCKIIREVKERDE